MPHPDTNVMALVLDRERALRQFKGETRKALRKLSGAYCYLVPQRDELGTDRAAICGAILSRAMFQILRAAE